MGGTPFETSSIYALIHALERQGGVWFPRGGTGALVQGMVRLFEDLGGKLELNAEVARIELVPEDIPRFLEEGLREETAAFFRRIGFAYAALDLLGYRTGSLNEALAEKP